MIKELAKRTLYLRMEGFSVHAIAEDIGMSSQTVAVYIKDITRNVASVQYVNPPTLPPLTKQDKVELSNIIVDNDGNIAAIQKQISDKLSARKILYCIRQKKPIAKKTTLSPALDAWRRKNGRTMSDLADMIEHPRASFIKIMHCKSHLRLNTALKIKAVTGVTLRELYAHQIEAINAEIRQIKMPEDAFAVPPPAVDRGMSDDTPYIPNDPYPPAQKDEFVCPPKRKRKREEKTA